MHNHRLFKYWHLDDDYSKYPNTKKCFAFVLDCYTSIFNYSIMERFNTYVNFDKNTGPKACPRRMNPVFPKGKDYTVYLSSEPLNFNQLVFQFAHEACHVIMDCYPQIEKFQWISECLCEAASLYMLRQCDASDMDKKMGYKAGTFKEYLDRQINRAFNEWPSGQSIATFFKENINDFESDPYGPLTEDGTIRWRNTVIGKSICDIIIDNPSSWKSISCMKDFVSEDSSSIDFLTAWEKECKENTVLPKGILNLLGF